MHRNPKIEYRREKTGVRRQESEDRMGKRSMVRIFKFSISVLRNDYWLLITESL